MVRPFRNDSKLRVVRDDSKLTTGGVVVPNPDPPTTSRISMSPSSSEEKAAALDTFDMRGKVRNDLYQTSRYGPRDDHIKLAGMVHAMTINLRRDRIDTTLTPPTPPQVTQPGTGCETQRPGHVTKLDQQPISGVVILSRPTTGCVTCALPFTFRRTLTTMTGSSR